MGQFTPDPEPTPQAQGPLTPVPQGMPDPTKGPVPVGVDTPNKFSRIIGMAQRPENQVLSPQAKLSLAVPGAGSFLSRLALQGGAQGAGALARGEGVERAGQSAAKGVLGQATGEGILKGAGAARNIVPTMSGGLEAFAKRAEGDVVKFLQSKVPAWKGTSSLKDMFYTQGGHDSLHQAYDDSLKEVVARGTGKMIEVPEAVAQAFKLNSPGGFQFPTGTASGRTVMGPDGTRVAVGAPAAPPTPGMVKVDAGQAAKAITGMWKKNPEGYRAIVNALDDAGIGDPAAREAYKTAMGVKGFMDKRRALTSGKLDVEKAQSGLNVESGSGELTKRGIEGPLRNILNPGGGPLIERSSLAVPGAVAGAGLGATLGGIGLPGIGHLGGGAGMGYLGHRIGSHVPTFKNVPQPPLSPASQVLRQQLIQSLLQQGAST